ncbi:hydrolase [Enterocloster clostridioformis]|uniref:HDIG domain-containing metalloprotein n=1 Tax=Enterocloster clostridioformis TaxID=1531 RepID=UPI00080C8AC4|nr:HDIG domain-containing metalloprotein [Enterocloster clostridioformis]ANU49765.1 hydrolase [Lachnoclostridium sp. YL32]NDO28760.1 HDIG domain-containing protein [Enterocloster clostridioformis]OXE71178.1 hydrolase [Enterocloster clostridioformis]QQR01327.1 HDIG domain-containing protein [Enterocloster clostridioformis]
MEKKMSREEAWELLTEYTKTPALRKHALAVESVMCHFARLNGEDEEFWGVAGLLHDLDYEKFPEEHCKKAEEIMREHGTDNVYIQAMNCHAYGICTNTKPESKMEQVLFTVDELTGLINALCLMRPSKSVLDLEVKSVKKKFKDRSFAAGVNRDVVKNGCEMLGVELDYIIRETIEGMKEKAAEIGLKGNL